MADDIIQITPNVVVYNSDTRRKIGNALWILALVAGVVALFFSFFPEAAFGTDIPSRAVSFINALVSLLAGSFGLAIVRPNTPTQEDKVIATEVKPAPLDGETREAYRLRTGSEL